MDDIARLERWTDSGAHWQVVRSGDNDVTIALITCTGSEEVDRLTSSDPVFLAWLAGRSSSED